MLEREVAEPEANQREQNKASSRRPGKESWMIFSSSSLFLSFLFCAHVYEKLVNIRNKSKQPTYVLVSKSVCLSACHTTQKREKDSPKLTWLVPLATTTRERERDRTGVFFLLCFVAKRRVVSRSVGGRSSNFCFAHYRCRLLGHFWEYIE